MENVSHQREVRNRLKNRLCYDCGEKLPKGWELITCNECNKKRVDEEENKMKKKISKIGLARKLYDKGYKTEDIAKTVDSTLQNARVMVSLIRKERGEIKPETKAKWGKKRGIILKYLEKGLRPKEIVEKTGFDRRYIYKIKSDNNIKTKEVKEPEVKVIQTPMVVELKEDNVICSDVETLVKIMGTTSVIGNLNYYGVSKDGKDFVVPLEKIRERIAKLEEDKVVIGRRLAVMRQLV